MGYNPRAERAAEDRELLAEAAEAAGMTVEDYLAEADEARAERIIMEREDA